MKFNDEYFLNIINNADFVDATKRQYFRNLDILQYKIFDNKSIHYIVFHPDDFIPNLDIYISGIRGRFEENPSASFKEAFVKPIITFFMHDENLRDNHPKIYEQWGKIKHILHKPSEVDSLTMKQMTV